MRLSTLAPCALALLAACSSSSSSTPAAPGALSAVVQDLGVDPDGLTTVVSLPATPSEALAPSHFQSDGGQSAAAVTVVGMQATVTWDDRVTPSDRVRVVGVANIAPSFSDVTTTDATAPSFTISAGQQNPGLGMDAFQAVFSGPRLVESIAEAPGTWRVLQGGNVYTLSDAAIDYDPVTGIVDFDLGASTSLHASFNVTATGLVSVADVPVTAGAVSGTASGDGVAPTLVSAVQNLSVDEFGRVVDFTFSEAMDPVTSLQLANFVVGLPVLASGVVQVADGVLRVTFTEPVVPGVDSVQLRNLGDLHGNDFADVTTPVAQGPAVVNAFASTPELRSVENADNDLLVVTFDQAIDPADGDDPAHWSLVVDSVTFDLSSATLDYDLLSKTLTVALGTDFTNGTAFDFGAASGNAPLDVDGDAFALSASSTVAGDSQVPRVAQIVQDRDDDPSGHTLDVTFNEAVDEVTAETFPNWSASGGQTLVSATLQADGKVLRLVYNAHIIPGETTLSTAGVEDLAGNAMLSSIMNPILSTDSDLPVPTLERLEAIEGPNNDVVVVAFDDTMIEAEVEDASNWSLQSPIGTAQDLSGASIVYDDVANQATLTLVGGDLEVRELALLVLSGVRDLGGNPVAPFPLVDEVTGDVVEPTLVQAWVDGVDDSLVHVRFSEPVKGFDDVYHPSSNTAGLTVLELEDGAGASLGFPAATTLAGDGLSATLDFDVSATAGVSVLDVGGVLDLAGNALFPVKGAALLAEDLTAPALSSGASSATAVSGEENDSLVVVFDRPVAPWGATDPTNYDFAQGGGSIDLANATASFDGVDTVTFALDQLGSDDLVAGASYTLTVSGIDSRFGVPISGTSVDTVVVGGDSIGPDSEAGGVRLAAQSPSDTLLADFDEAVLPADGGDVTAYDISSVNPNLATLVGPRTSALTFGSVNLGETVNFQLRDRAGNLGLSSELVAAADSTAPVAAAAAGVAVPGVGGDRVVVTFTGLVDETTALELTHYAVSQGGVNVSLAGATARYASGANQVALLLADGVNLQDGVDVDVVVANVEGHSGLVMTQAALVGATTGDSVAPSLDRAFLNYREEFQGRVVDVYFSEDVSPVMPSTPTAWSATGGLVPTSAVVLDDHLVRLTFPSALTGTEELSLIQAVDPAGNVGSALTVTVVD